MIVVDEETRRIRCQRIRIPLNRERERERASKIVFLWRIFIVLYMHTHICHPWRSANRFPLLVGRFHRGRPANNRCTRNGSENLKLNRDPRSLLGCRIWRQTLRAIKPNRFKSRTVVTVEFFGAVTKSHIVFGYLLQPRYSEQRCWNQVPDDFYRV